MIYDHFVKVTRTHKLITFEEYIFLSIEIETLVEV